MRKHTGGFISYSANEMTAEPLVAPPLLLPLRDIAEFNITDCAYTMP
jgi:hypothetical protein